MHAAAGAAAAAAAIAQAIKASGTIVRIEPPDFERLVRRLPNALVVHTIGGLFSKTNQYLTSYKGLAFYTKSRETLSLSSDCEVIEAKSMWMPG